MKAKNYIILFSLLTLWHNETWAQNIDSVTATYQGTIYSGYSADSCSGGCLYALPLIIPAGTSVSDIKLTFDFRERFPCYLDEVGFSVSLNGCRSYCFRCGVHVNTGGFYCLAENLSVMDSLKTCLPGPKCTDDTEYFALDFHRIVNPGNGCDSNCYVGALLPYSIKLMLQTAKTKVSSDMDTICKGGSVLLSLVDSFAVAPYTVAWSADSMTGNGITVSPVADSTFIASITDACGNTSKDSIRIIVNTCTGLESYADHGFTVYPNPSNGTVIIQSSEIKSSDIYIEAFNLLNQKVLSAYVDSESLRKGQAFNFGISGFYLIYLKAGSEVFVNRIAIIK